MTLSFIFHLTHDEKLRDIESCDTNITAFSATITITNTQLTNASADTHTKYQLDADVRYSLNTVVTVADVMKWPQAVRKVRGEQPWSRTERLLVAATSARLGCGLRYSREVWSYAALHSPLLAAAWLEQVRSVTASLFYHGKIVWPNSENWVASKPNRENLYILQK